MPTLAVPPSVVAIAEALLIGFLIGAQREASQGEGHPGVRDFVLIALIGGICGLLQNPWLTAASLLAVTTMLGVFYFQVRQRSGITTEMAAVATYCLGFLAASPGTEHGEPLAIGISVVVVGFLEAKRSLHKLVRETITEVEFNDTLRFLAIIFIIYPILPEGEYGPFQFLSPRRIWVFVILVSSVSYAGYFLTKFLGARRGLKLAGLLGGLASTTAATSSFAVNSMEAPEHRALYAQAAVIANAVQFPRILLILALVSPALAGSALVPLAVMTVAGLLAALILGRTKEAKAGPPPLTLRNPFRVWPAVKFGALFGTILFASKAGTAWFGTQAVYWTSGLAGSLDVDAVALSLADLLGRGSVTPALGVGCVLLALLANALVKTGIAFYSGAPAFGG
jgi:uncharacterized membrane protein (DUF4010 family)